MYSTGTCVRTYFRQFVVSLKIPKLCSLLPGVGAGAAPKQAGSETLIHSTATNLTQWAMQSSPQLYCIIHSSKTCLMF